MKLTTISSALLLVATVAPASAQTISLECTVSEWVVETGFKHRGDYNRESKDPSEYKPFFITVDFGTMTASSNGGKFDLGVQPHLLTLTRGILSPKTSQANPYQRIEVQRDTLKFKAVVMTFGGLTGIFQMDTKGQCVKAVAPAGNQI